MVAGLSVVHGLVPPHPAALLAVTIYNADVGRTIFYALIVGLPTAIHRRAALSPSSSRRHVSICPPTIRWPTSCRPRQSAACPASGSAAHHPAAGAAHADRQLGRRALRNGSVLNQALHLAGNDDMALLIGVLISFVTLGTMRGFSRQLFCVSATSALRPPRRSPCWSARAEASAASCRIAASPRPSSHVALHSHVPLLLLAWLLAAACALPPARPPWP